MSIFDFVRKKKEAEKTPGMVCLTSAEAYDMLCADGYASPDKNPEIVAACRKIAVLISSMTLHLMENGENGDVRIVNELSRKIDIHPNRFMTRRTWMEGIVMDMLLYGRGNSIVRVHTEDHGRLLGDFEIIPPGRFSLVPDGYGYYVLIDGVKYQADEVLHFVENPDSHCPWMGRGLTVCLKDIADSLKQEVVTKKAFLKSEWKPSVIVKVDALTEEFSGAEGRRKLLESYVKPATPGEPWLIPAEQFDVTQVKPLTLKDLAIDSTVELDRRTVAAVTGVPPFLVGVGEYDSNAWNAFVENTVRPIAEEIEQELTRKLILSPKWYLRFNILSLMNWDIKTIADVFGGLSDRGLVTGNEVRDRIGMSPKEGLDELRILENYIPSDMIGSQKKLIQNGEKDDGEK